MYANRCSRNRGSKKSADIVLGHTLIIKVPHAVTSFLNPSQFVLPDTCETTLKCWKLIVAIWQVQQRVWLV